MDRNTIQCDLVRQAVAKLDHPTAEEVYANIAAAHPTVGKCTVYRNLKKLCDNGEDVILHAGDVAYTPDGSYHGIENIGDEPLELIALIVFH